MTKDFSHIDVRALRYLKILVDERNVSKAATVLGISQPSLSGSLAKLRQVFGDPLFIRTANGMDPTPCAMALAELCADVVSRLDDIHAKTSVFSPATCMRSFRVQANDYSIHIAVGRMIALVRQQAPGISIVVDYVPDLDFRERLESGEVDLNIGYLPDVDESLHRFSFMNVEVCCIVSRNHQTVRDEISLEDYVNSPHLCLSLGRGDRASFIDRSLDSMLAELGHIRNKAAQVPTWLTMPTIVAQTDLIATVPLDLAVSASKDLPIQVLRLPFANFSLNLSVVWHDRSDKDPAIRWLRGLFRTIGAGSERRDGVV